jgi:hypothetical protein
VDRHQLRRAPVPAGGSPRPDRIQDLPYELVAEYVVLVALRQTRGLGRLDTSPHGLAVDMRVAGDRAHPVPMSHSLRISLTPTTDTSRNAMRPTSRSMSSVVAYRQIAAGSRISRWSLVGGRGVVAS